MKKPALKSLALVVSLLFLLFLVDRTVRFFIRADTCIDAAQWENLRNDPNNCYVLYQRNGRTEVFQPPVLFSRSRKTHQGNDICGTDITSLIPASHISDPAKYLTDTYRGNLYSTCQAAPTSTPNPSPTSTPSPTSAPTTTSAQPTSSPNKTVVLSPIPTQEPTPTITQDTLLVHKSPHTSSPAPFLIPSPTPDPTLLSAQNLVLYTKILDYFFLIVVIGVIIFWLVTVLKPKPLPAKK